MKGKNNAHRKEIRILTVILLIFVLLVAVAFRTRHQRALEYLDYADSLDLAAAKMNGEEITLRKIGFYVAYEEAMVEEQAAAYSPEDTEQYWNLHTNRGWIRVISQKAAMNMALHDTLFAQMAEEAGITLSAEETADIQEAEAFFWEDYMDDVKLERMGIQPEDLHDAIEKMAYAQKYQEIYAVEQEEAAWEYDIGGSAYEKLLKKQDYKIYKEVWEHVDFGNVTLFHKSVVNGN